MAFDNKEFIYTIDESLDEVVDEGANSMIALRRVKWGDSETANPKVEVRRWYINSNGEEKAGKGTSFITETGPGNLAVALLKHGFGDTREVIDNIRYRDDFNISMRKALSDRELDDIKSIEVPTNQIDPSYYDPKSMIG